MAQSATNDIDPIWFAARPARDTELVHVVFFGRFLTWEGTPVIGAAIADLASDPRFVFTIIGTGPDLAQVRSSALANAWVTWRERVTAEALPAVVAAHDVCLGIFGASPRACSTVPPCVRQGAAAGCAVITSDTPAQRAAFADAAILVAPGDPRALAESLRRLADDPDELTRLRQAARDRARNGFAAVPPAAAGLPAIAELPAAAGLPAVAGSLAVAEVPAIAGLPAVARSLAIAGSPAGRPSSVAAQPSSIGAPAGRAAPA